MKKCDKCNGEMMLTESSIECEFYMCLNCLNVLYIDYSKNVVSNSKDENSI